MNYPSGLITSRFRCFSSFIGGVTKTSIHKSLVPFPMLKCPTLLSRAAGRAAQTVIFLKQTFKAWWGPLDAYVSVNPIQTVLRINMEKDCLSDLVAVALRCMWHCKSLSPTGYLRAQHLKTGLMLGHGKPGLRVSTALLFHRATRLL